MLHFERIGRLDYRSDSLKVEIMLVVLFFQFVENIAGGLAGGGIAGLHVMEPRQKKLNDKSVIQLKGIVSQKAELKTVLRALSSVDCEAES